ncbi:MAG: hypothetical protein ACJASF_001234 [Vicingaceae bacterium]|jgi:hypothetical protein
MIQKTIPFIFAIFLFFSTTAQEEKPVDVVKASLIAYNNVDIDAFMSYFSEDIVMKDYDNGKINANGKAEVRAIYEPYFKASPNLHSKIIDRIAFDNKVMDHEYITGARGSEEPFEIVVIYEVTDGKISSMLAVRKSSK